ncbi:hypothetical protein L1049_018141 [Liquidambar formosana]|uniref:Peptidase metallopeptidase domain-containing protein n=1 Tax=Liquidambar formosana TaxID=63359 RepID=A0AAP0NHA3_LIQFO
MVFLTRFAGAYLCKGWNCGRQDPLTAFTAVYEKAHLKLIYLTMMASCHIEDFMGFSHGCLENANGTVNGKFCGETSEGGGGVNYIVVCGGGDDFGVEFEEGEGGFFAGGGGELWGGLDASSGGELFGDFDDVGGGLRRTTPKLTPESVTVITVKNHSNTWHGFERFLDARRGSHVSGMSELKKYFHRFGYFTLHDNNNITDIFDARLEFAVTRYQAKLGLPVTGKLDADTLSQISMPRCGVPDMVQSMRATGHYVYFPGRPRWARHIPMTLTYAFSPDYLIDYLSLDDIRAVFKRAFGRWASVIPAERWAVDFGSEKSKVAVDLESVATHEIGHLLGLAHTPVKEAVMYPSLRPRDKKVDLKVDDIEGVQALYGSNPNFSFGSLLESDISSNQAVDFRPG